MLRKERKSSCPTEQFNEPSGQRKDFVHTGNAFTLTSVKTSGISVYIFDFLFGFSRHRSKRHINVRLHVITLCLDVLNKGYKMFFAIMSR